MYKKVWYNDTGNTSLHSGAVCDLWSVHCNFIILIVLFLTQAFFAPMQLKALKSGTDGQVAKTIKPSYHPHANWEIICVWSDTTKFFGVLSLPVGETALFFCAWIKRQIISSLVTSGGQSTTILYLSENRNISISNKSSVSTWVELWTIMNYFSYCILFWLSFVFVKTGRNGLIRLHIFFERRDPLYLREMHLRFIWK